MATSLDRDAVAAVDSTGQVGGDPRPRRRTCATRCGAWTPPASRPSTRPGGLIVAGMGGSAVGGAARARRAGRAADAAAARSPTATRCPAGRGRTTLVLCSSYSGDTEETLAAYDDAVERGRAAARGARPAARWPSAPARDGVPVIPMPGGFQPRAAVGYSLVSALEAAALGGARALAARRGRGGGRRSPSAGRGVGAGRRRGRRGEGARPRAARHGAGDRRARSSRAAAAYRWKCQINENAELPGVRRARCRSSTTTRSSAGPRRASSAASPPCSSRTRTPHPRDVARASS